MIIIRPISQRDTEDFINFSFTAGVGITSMPKDRSILKQKILDSEKAFSKEVIQPYNENYLFVLEDLSTKIIGGTCGIDAKTGIDQPKYFFQIDNESIPANPSQKLPLLHVVRYKEAPSEICSLYLQPEFRREGLGRLLSLSRFLFVAAHPHRFDSIIYAEMRGFVDKNQSSPFWEGIGRHFFDLDYASLMRQRDHGNFDIEQVVPKYPIYIPLLPKEVQEMIGKIHTNTWPAFHMLSEEGFYLTDDIDVFDAGPRIEAETTEIRTVKTCNLDPVAEIVRNPIESVRYIVCNNRLDFRACYSTLQKGEKGIFIPEETASALQVKVGDLVRYVAPSPEISSHPIPHNGSHL